MFSCYVSRAVSYRVVMIDPNSENGALVIVSGPSGVGKSTICQEVIKRLSYVRLSVSVTTRPKAESEADGQDYRFVSKQQFQELIDKGLLLEHAEVFGNFYGTPKDNIDSALESGETIILEIDVQGAQQVKLLYPDSLMMFILPPTHKELAERLNHRGREEVEVVEERLNGADSEIAAAWQYYEYLIINDKLEQAVDEIVQIIKDCSGARE